MGVIGMYIFMLLLWLIFNGRITVEILIIGMGICSWLFWFVCKFMDYDIKKEIYIMKRSLKYIHIFMILVLEVIKSNIAVTKIILSPKLEMEPCTIKFKTSLKKSVTKTCLANFITLTPGTFTILLEEDEYTIHALDKSFVEHIEESIFVKKLKQLEE